MFGGGGGTLFEVLQSVERELDLSVVTDELSD